MTATTASRTLDRVRPLLRASAAGCAAAVIAAVAVHGLARVAGDPLVVTVEGRGIQQVSTGAVIAVTVAAAVAATAVALFARLAPRPRVLFLVVSFVALVLSLLPPAAAASGATTWWLDGMHIAVFAGLVPAMARALPDRPGSAVQHPARTAGPADAT